MNLKFKSVLQWVLARPMKMLVLAVTAIVSIGMTGYVVRLNHEPGSQQRYLIQAPMAHPYAGRNLIGWLTQNGFDVAGFSWRDGVVEVVTDQAGVQQLNAHGLRTALRPDVTHGIFGLNSIDPRYLNPTTVESGLKALNAQFPAITHLEQIGTSLQGRPIWALLISSTPDLTSGKMYEKPAIIFDGMHHAREIMTPEIVMDVAQTLLSAVAAQSPGAMAVLQRWNVWVVPMLNVDGNNLVWTKDSMWRKNAHGDHGSVYGVDINRNYPFKWASCGGSSGNANAQDFHGASGASEPETQAMMRLGQLAQPTGSLSYHSYSELVLYPYGCNGVLSGENALLAKIGNELAAILPADSGRGNYTPGTPWQILYSVDGDSMSYLHSEFGATALTFEVNQDFLPPYSLREPTLQKHRKAWQYFINRMETNLFSLRVTDSRRAGPVQARIEISTLPHQYGEKPFHTNPAGNFFKVLDPGTYAIRVTLADGRTAESSVVMQGHGQAIQVQVP